MKRGIVVFLIVVISCRKDAFVKSDNGIIDNYKFYVNTLGNKYTGFEIRNIDFNKISDSCYQEILKYPNSTKLLSSIQFILDTLNDRHNWIAGINDNYNTLLRTTKHVKPNLDYNYLLHNFFPTCINSDQFFYKKFNNNVGYIFINSFSGEVDNNYKTLIENIMFYLKSTNGLIIDIRNNQGGNNNRARFLASFFTDKTTVYGYYKRKISETTYSDYLPLSIAEASYNYAKPVVLLTSRTVFSTANEFVLMMKSGQKTLLMGDVTGGGGGIPVTNQMPNGWLFSYSGSKMFDIEKRDVDLGIVPDKFLLNNINSSNPVGDNLIDSAIALLK